MVVILGIIASIAVENLSTTSDTVRTRETLIEMDHLAHAIAGNPEHVSGGRRTDFGYVGDVGALPSSWNDLIVNPGGYSTWEGPYLHSDFSGATTDTLFKYDAWGMQYSGPGSQFSSNGSGQVITWQVASSPAELLYNRITVALTDLDHTPPGAHNIDSVRCFLTVPDGAGGTVVLDRYPPANGLIEFDSIPIGVHSLRAVYYPDFDTITRKVTVHPGQDSHLGIQHFANIWMPDTTEEVTGNIILTGNITMRNSNRSVQFYIYNNGTIPIVVTSIKVTFTSDPTAYFQRIRWQNTNFWDYGGGVRAATGETKFNTQTINPGQQRRLRLVNFKEVQIGNGPNADMRGQDIMIEFSDGSVITFTTPS